MRFATFTHAYTGEPLLIAVDRIYLVDTDTEGTFVSLSDKTTSVRIGGTIEQAMAALDHAKRTFTMFGWVTGNGGREVFIGTPERAKEAAKYGKVIPVYTVEEEPLDPYYDHA